MKTRHGGMAVLMGAIMVWGCLEIAQAAGLSDLPLPIPPQDQGLPYTRSARPMARAAVGDAIALFPGSRYAYAYGYRCRLDPQHPLAGEAIERGGILYIPDVFAGVILAEKQAIKADPAPAYLAERYVHVVKAPRPKIKEGSVRQIQDKGRTFMSVEDLARNARKSYLRHNSGLVLVGEPAQPFLKDPVRTKAVITLFDTPETLADPGIATEYIPLLKRQGPWTQWVKHTPEQLKLLDGPETEWPLVPKEQFDYTGFAFKLLGSKVPPPGIYPRLLFSPDDLPMLRDRVKNDRMMAYSFAEMETLLKTSWLDPKADESKAFDRLASGRPIEVAELSADDQKRAIPMLFGLFAGMKPRIAWSHVSYVGHCLVALQFYALIKDDAVLGKKAAAAAVTYAESMERILDAINAKSDSEFGIDYDNAQGAETGFRIRAMDHMDLPFLLDFGGKWMTSQQKDSLRRVIAKATYGCADTHAAGSLRWEENNHTTWHTTIFLEQMAIEGLEGSDPENFPRAVRTIQAFSEFGIDSNGVVFESNGKSGAGFRNVMLNMVALARRGENYFGHPHWRKLIEAQAQCTAPNGQTTVTSGTYAGGLFDPQGLMFLKAFYPGNRYADWLLTKTFPEIDLTPAAVSRYLDDLKTGKKRARMPIMTAPLSKRGTLYDTEHTPTRRDDIHLPLVFESKEHGIFSASSDESEQAAWINLMVRENGYLGGGHQHADSGLFHFSAGGVNWIQESPLNSIYEGNLHNHVLIDGKSTPDGTGACGRYLGSVTKDNLAAASCDLTRAYTWKWIQQVMLWDVASWWSARQLSQEGVEFEDDPGVIAAFKGTQHYKMRNWWPSYTFGNWIPTSRLAYNPVEYAHRSVGLVRGKHAYGIVMDDLKKDARPHHYQWTACPGRGVWKSDYTTAVQALPPNQAVLGFEGPQAFAFGYKYAQHHDKPDVLTAKDGEPQLLVCVLNALTPPAGMPLLDVINREGPRDTRNNKPNYYDNIVINHQGMAASFRVVLIPFKRGERLPQVRYDAATQTASVCWDDQVDTLRFVRQGDGTGVILENR